ncbi:hypothetical protein RB653_001564 [Dictyostelium firmibasis]|uniref:Uncharacterized protein n=1 Tax=Dictyostelium firmibasis TaxID=79012 RepID=A0AAN7TX57_9MYCE
MRFKSHESNKYLQESWDKANHDNKKTVVHIDEKTLQPNLTSGKVSILKELKPQYDELKQEQIKSSKQDQSKDTKPSTPSPTTTTATLGFVPNTAKPWQKI